MKEKTYRKSILFALLLIAQMSSCMYNEAPPLLPAGTSAPGNAGIVSTTAGAGPRVSIDISETVGKTPAMYGSNGWWTDQDGEIWKERYQELGVKIVRIPAAQSLFEPVNDDADPKHIHKDGFLFNQPIPWEGKTVTLSKWLAMLKSLDLMVMLQIPYLPAWNSRNPQEERSSPYPPSSLPEYEEYVTALLQFVVDDIGFDPSKVILEPVNEPDLGCSEDPNVHCFWDGWNGQDLLDVLQAARASAKKVDSKILMVGLSECHGTTIVDRLVSNYDGMDILDGFSYHKYVPNDDFHEGIDWGKHLLQYQKPVFLNEYGSTKYWSDGIDGALWHAHVLPELFRAGIQPIQFPISHFAGSHQGYENLGLFKDWRDHWEKKPAYWVYANFYRYFGDADVLRQPESSPAPIFAVKKVQSGDEMVALWINPAGRQAQEITISMEGFSSPQARVFVIDNLTGTAPIDQLALKDQPIEFALHLEPLRSYTILVTNGSEIFLPSVKR